MFLFDLPEKIRKPFSDVFRGIKGEHGQKRVIVMHFLQLILGLTQSKQKKPQTNQKKGVY